MGQLFQGRKIVGQMNYSFPPLISGVRADGFAAEQSPTTQHTVLVNIFLKM